MANYDDMTKAELMEEAQRLDVSGRSTMDKDELLAAVKQADAGAAQVAYQEEAQKAREANGGYLPPNYHTPQTDAAQAGAAAAPNGEAMQVNEQEQVTRSE